jgi:hypothetical protein
MIAELRRNELWRAVLTGRWRGENESKQREVEDYMSITIE